MKTNYGETERGKGAKDGGEGGTMEQERKERRVGVRLREGRKRRTRRMKSA